MLNVLHVRFPKSNLIKFKYFEELGEAVQCWNCEIEFACLLKVEKWLLCGMYTKSTWNCLHCTNLIHFSCIKWLPLLLAKRFVKLTLPLYLHKTLQANNSCLFIVTGCMETCNWKGQSHARPLGTVSSGGHQDRTLHSLQVWITLHGYEFTAVKDIFRTVAGKTQGKQTWLSCLKCVSKPCQRSSMHNTWTLELPHRNEMQRFVYTAKYSIIMK